MASVVFLRGVNVGGHRTFRPSVVANELHRHDVVNVGAAGTFVVRRPVSQGALRREIERLLPFETEVMICRGTDVLRLVRSDPLADHQGDPQIVPFVSVLAQNRAPSAPLPRQYPDAGDGAWGVRLLGQQGRFVFGVYRRNMKSVGHLSQVDRLFGAPATTRNWNTMMTIARLLDRSTRAR